MQIATIEHSQGWSYSTQSYGGREIRSGGSETKRGYSEVFEKQITFESLEE